MLEPHIVRPASILRHRDAPVNNIVDRNATFGAQAVVWRCTDKQRHKVFSLSNINIWIVQDWNGPRGWCEVAFVHDKNMQSSTL